MKVSQSLVFGLIRKIISYYWLQFNSKPAKAHADTNIQVTSWFDQSQCSSSVFNSLLPPAGEDSVIPPLCYNTRHVDLYILHKFLIGCISTGFGGLAETSRMAGRPPQREIWCVGSPASRQTNQTVWKPLPGGQYQDFLVRQETLCLSPGSLWPVWKNYCIMC